jgi:polyisoprenyl-phosphate glycosyltransferase
MIDLAVVVPCYNEEAVLGQTCTQLLAQLDKLRTEGLVGAGSGLYFVDDGSRDATWRLIEELARTDSRVQ